MTQGGPLAMIEYGIIILPLIKNLKWEIPDTTQPCYADYSGSLGTFAILEIYFYSLTLQDPGRGYHPKPSKSVIIVHPDNLESGKVFGACHGYKVCTVARYLGGYIGYDESKRNWLRERTLTWENKISTISENAGKYPQESYSVLVHAI